MRHRKYRSRPPTSPSYTSGEVLTFATPDDKTRISELAELTPVGPEPIVLTFTPEDNKTTQTKSVTPRQAAFLTKLAGCDSVQSSASSPEPENVLSLNHWADVVADPTVWPALTTFLVRTGRYDGTYDDGRVVRLFLCVGGVLLANYWLATHGLGLRKFVVEWLRDYWREEWEQLSDEAKRVVVQDFAERLARAEGAKDIIHEIALAIQKKV